MNRRKFLAAGTTLGLAATAALPALAAEGDGTPMQFMPKKAKDPTPLVDELTKYPKCPYCGMDRKEYHFSRHLVHYSDDLVDGTCSLHCAAISLSVNLDRVPKAIYAPDNGSGDAIKPMTSAEGATYVIGGDHKGVMTKKPKTSFASKLAAEAAKGDGELADFNKALTATYLGMAEDTMMIRMKRDEKRRHMMGDMHKG
ncbi:twin-arginine translocation pathway signal protein [Paramagnetospirillum kuznetsovii]|uniref:Twin-arginine translocation pathway signal protein n=1 Tax=Paramagnetospirillum kuznetsovii TaxID=2053833 RepID=A0A364NTF8_9PROT|nr:nitrous oxide reductase accessory protein NosL [Paramagnetospirillum kuznetsovii]RAU20332.1 twin-arginine translocation pathway signal protein [Paramagnetospirillum kuznetsovii]